jgi:hypothetical protein
VGCRKSTTIGESTSGKSLAIGIVLGNSTEVRMGSTYGQGESGKREGK